MKIKIPFALFICLFLFICTTTHAQNAGINTDGSTPETGVMLDVKGTNPITTTATQNIFQIKSFNASGAELKMRMVLGTHATAGSRYGALEVYDAGAAAYRALALQPLGGYVGIATTNPAALLDILHSTGVPTSGAFRVSRAIGQSTYISPIYGGGPAFYSYIGTISSAVETNNVTLHTTGNVTFDNGSVGIGVTPPTAKLDVQGTSGNTIKIVDGNQGANKVLTSDAAGVGSWQSLSAIGGACFQNSYAYTANNTWTCPAGVTRIFVEVWGGGGGGFQGGAIDRNGGGGGGAYAAAYVTVVPTTNYAVVVGGGGATNAAGGTSRFDTPLLVAGGGFAGTAGSPGAGGIASSTIAGATLISGGIGNANDFFFSADGGGDNRWYGKGGQAGGNGGPGGYDAYSGNPPGGGGGAYGTGAAGMVIVRW